MSFAVVRYRRQNPSVTESTNTAFFITLAEAEAYANQRNSIAPIEGAVWYEAHPLNYSQVSPQPPTPDDPTKTLADLKAQRDVLSTTAELYQNSRSRGSVLLYIGLSVALVFGFATPAWILAKEYYFPSIFGSAATILVLASLRDSRRAGKNELRGEEWLFLRAHRVLQNLTDYLNGKTSFPHFKKKAQDELRVLVRRVESRWTIGQFELAKNALTPLKLLKEGLRQRLLRAFEDEEEEHGKEKEKMELCQRNMIEFCLYLLKEKPQLADVNRLISMLWLLPPKSVKKNVWKRFSEWFKLNFKILVVVPAALSLTSGPILFALATSFNVASGKDALAPAVTASVGFTGIYVTVWVYRNREKKRSE